MLLETDICGKTQFTVLIVDDDLTMSKLIKQNLGGTNTQVIEVSSGLECMKVLHYAQVDLILLDIKLPDFNGWGVLSLLRLTNQFREIPVIVVSIDSPDTDLLTRFSLTDYVQKPFDMRDLLKRIQKVIESKNAGKCIENKAG